MLSNNHQLREHAGPRFDYWRRRTLASFGIFAVESPPPAE